MSNGTVKKLSQKVSLDVAEEEINKWLDCKRVNAKKRESYEDYIETLINAIADGFLTLSEDNALVQKLRFPLENESPLSELSYKPRLKVSTIHTHLNGVKSSDADGRICAYVAALTSKPKDVIKGLDTEDYSIAQAIAAFFL